MRPYVSEENGFNCDDGIVPYDQLQTAQSETVAGYGHLYSFEITKCKFLSDILSRPVINLEEFGLPQITTNIGRDTVAS
jgi:hypothetical protein